MVVAMICPWIPLKSMRIPLNNLRKIHVDGPTACFIRNLLYIDHFWPLGRKDHFLSGSRTEPRSGKTIRAAIEDFDLVMFFFLSHTHCRHLHIKRNTQPCHALCSGSEQTSPMMSPGTGVAVPMFLGKKYRLVNKHGKLENQPFGLMILWTIVIFNMFQYPCLITRN